MGKMSLIAFYLRLSRMDEDTGSEGKDESNSIENQRALLQTYLENRKDINGTVIEYIDDGYSGTNFDRPAFKRMIADAKRGNIQVILTKDLSRFGRDYIGVGDYLEQVFPVLGIRFIAVNSYYDSNDYIGKTMGLEMEVTNLVNTLYSRDLSVKCKSAIVTKWNQGISTVGRVPFGYVKVKDDTDKWEIDPEAAGYVKMIFECAVKGWDISSIANHLNTMHVPPPGKYKEMKKQYRKWQRKVTDKEWLWDYTKVYVILNRYQYTGALVQGMRQLLKVGSRHQRAMPESEYYVYENHHEAIVTHQEFEMAQRIIRRQSINNTGVKADYVLRGKIRCGNCRLAMYADMKGTPVVYCNHAHLAGKMSGCHKERYPIDKIENTVRLILNKEIEFLLAFGERVEEKQLKVFDVLKERIEKNEREIEICNAERIRQYEVYAEGKVSKEAYIEKKETLGRTHEQLENEREYLQTQWQSETQIKVDMKSVCGKASEVVDKMKLTKAAVVAFIDTVYIYDENHIEVVFNFEDILKRTLERYHTEENLKEHSVRL